MPEQLDLFETTYPLHVIIIKRDGTVSEHEQQMDLEGVVLKERLDKTVPGIHFWFDGSKYHEVILDS